MRITADNWAEFFQDPPTIYLNGIVMDLVQEADEEAGYILITETDAKGDLFMKNGEPVSRKLTGRVSIEGPRLEHAVTVTDHAGEAVYGDFMGLQAPEIKWIAAEDVVIPGDAVYFPLISWDIAANLETVRVTPSRSAEHEKALDELWAGRLTPNQVREQFDLPPVEGGDIYLKGDLFKGCKLVEGPFIPDGEIIKKLK
jgi:hypothetical protein